MDRDEDSSKEPVAQTKGSDSRATEAAVDDDLVDAELARAVEAGSADAEARFAARFLPTLVFYLRRRRDVRDDEVDDLAQETLVLTLKKLRSGGLDRPERLGAFVRHTAVNLLIAARRKTKRQQALLEFGQDSVVPSEPDDLATGMLLRARVDAVRAAIESLPTQRDRDILRAYYVQELDKPVICDLLGIDARHFDRVISRARSRFRLAWQATDKDTKW
ncbi:MAG: sigma-70 family RNA polymerase sigma factor [Pseudomonadota bacterium]